MKILLNLGLSVVILGFGLVTSEVIGNRVQDKKEQAPEKALPLVEAMVVSPQSVTFNIQTQGTVMAHSQLQLRAEVNGTVQTLHPHFRQGGFFKKGEVLITLDPADYRLALTTAKAQLIQQQSLLVQEQAKARNAVAEWQSQSKKPVPDLVARKPQLALAKARVASANAQVDRAQRDLDRCTLKAPFDGTVRAKNVTVGSFVTAQGQELALLTPTDFIEIQVPLTSADLAFIQWPEENKEEASARIHFTFGGKTVHLKGQLDRLDSQVHPQNRVYYGIVKVEKPYQGDHPLMVGTFAQVELTGKTLPNIYAVPNRALKGSDQILVLKPQESGTHHQIDLRQVTVLRTTNKTTYISKGLHAGESVCLTGLPVVTQNMPVKILDDAQKPKGDHE